MELINIVHPFSSGESDLHPDLFIAGLNFESRSTCIAKILDDPGRKKVVLASTERRKELARPQNDDYFKAGGYSFFLSKPFQEPDFKAVFSDLDMDHIKILIDITTMTRHWYHAFLQFLHDNKTYEKADVRISYCPALFYEQVSPGRKMKLSNFSLDGDNRIHTKQRKKTALIMGLGNDRGIGEAVYNTVKPDHAVLLYADPAVHKSYVESIFVNNHKVISHVDMQNLICYPLRDTEKLYRTLLDLILPLREKYNIQIVPQGPKIFSVLAMLFHLNYPDVMVRYPEYKIRDIKDRKSHANHLSLDLEFATE